MSDQIFYLFSAVLLGIVIGSLVMYFISGSNKESDKTIAKLEKELESYQQNVAEHFEQTADLVDGMTESYKKVFDHLGKSARNLMTEEQIQKQLETRKGNKVTLEYLTETSEDEQSAQDTDETKVSVTTETEPVEDVIAESKPLETEAELIANAGDSSTIEMVENALNESTNSDEFTSKISEDSNSVEKIESIAKEVELKKLEKEVELREKNIYS